MPTDPYSLQWYTRRDGVIRGPFSPENITRYILLGRIQLNDELSADRHSWTSANYFSELLPPELQNLSSWDDYQQLVIARQQVDERKSERRRQVSGVINGSIRTERRGRINRRRGDSDLLSVHDIQPSGLPDRPITTRTLLMTLLLATLLFSWLVPAQA